MADDWKCGFCNHEFTSEDSYDEVECPECGQFNDECYDVEVKKL